MLIKKFNEKFNEINLNYVTNCFIQFYDDDKFSVVEVYGSYFDFHVYIKYTLLQGCEYVEFISNINELNTLMLDINSCIEKLKLEYKFDGIHIELNYEHNFIEIKFALD